MPLKLSNISTQVSMSINILPRCYFKQIHSFLLYGWRHGLFNESTRADIWLVLKLFYYHKQSRDEHNRVAFTDMLNRMSSNSQQECRRGPGCSLSCSGQRPLAQFLHPGLSAVPMCLNLLLTWSSCTQVRAPVGILKLQHEEGASEQQLRAVEDGGSSAGCKSQGGGSW